MQYVEGTTHFALKSKRGDNRLWMRCSAEGSTGRVGSWRQLYETLMTPNADMLAILMYGPLLRLVKCEVLDKIGSGLVWGKPRTASQTPLEHSNSQATTRFRDVVATLLE